MGSERKGEPEKRRRGPNEREERRREGKNLLLGLKKTAGSRVERSGSAKN